MIPRYAKPEMESIWTDDNKFKIMLEVEILASEAMSKLGVVPKAAIDKVRKKRIYEVEDNYEYRGEESTNSNTILEMMVKPK